jgi:hypothetical protein
MKIMKYLVAAMLATVLLSAGSLAQTELNLDYWDGFVTKGANILSGYAPDTNSLATTVPERASTVSERGFGGP